MKASEVFTPGAHPTVTFVDSHIKALRTVLTDTLATGSLVITLSGPSKSGKTVFVEEAVGKGNLIHVTGAGVETPAALWNRVFAVIGTPIGKVETSGTKTTTSGSGKVSGGVPLLASGEVSTGIQHERNSGSTDTLPVRWTPKIGQRGSLSPNSNPNDPDVQKTSSA